MSRDDLKDQVVESGDPVGETSTGTATETLDADQGGAEQGEARQGEPAVPELSEAEVLRADLERAQAEVGDFKNRFLRARADLENYRRRAAQDVARAREAGLDSAILPLLAVYDDLGRALSMADEGDPSRLIPGIQAVREGLKRNIQALGMAEIGQAGEPFDPDFHEALTAVPTQNAEQVNTIAEVVQTGFVKDERLVRPARVVVFQD